MSIHNGRGNRARYTVALHEGYDSNAVKPDAEFREGQIPAALSTVRNLNFLDPTSRLFHTDMALVSYGQYIGKPTPRGMFAARDRSKVTIYGDSGGYQFARGTKPWRGDLTRREALEWLEAHADVAMVLDIPTLAISVPRSEFRTFAACLTTTIENLRYFDKHRAGHVPFLNVLQGTSRDEADAWYEAVKHYPFEGWALAGALRLDFFEVCRRVAILCQEKQINERQNRIHVLGTARLEMQVLLTALQRALREHVEPTVTITFDSSTPFLLTSFFVGCAHPVFSPEAFKVLKGKLPRTHRYTGSDRRFPFGSSAMGRRLLLGDLCVPGGHVKQSSWDSLSVMCVANHSLEVMLSAFEDADAVLDLEPKEAEQFAPHWLVRAVAAVRGMFRAKEPMNALRRHKADLTRLVALPQPDEVEEARFSDEL